MVTTKMANGHLLIARRAEGPGGMVGDGVEEIDETHPHWALHLAAWERQEARTQDAQRAQPETSTG